MKLDNPCMSHVRWSIGVAELVAHCEFYEPLDACVVTTTGLWWPYDSIAERGGPPRVFGGNANRGRSATEGEGLLYVASSSAGVMNAYDLAMATVEACVVVAGGHNQDLIAI